MKSGRIVALTGSVFLSIAAVCAAQDAKPQTPPDKGDGLRAYHIGNSHTDSVRDGLMPIAVAAGHTRHNFSTSIILGAPLRWIWEHDADCRNMPWSKGLAADQKWDAITLQVYASDDREMECAAKFADLAYKGNPRCQVYLYTIWPGAKDDWEQPPLVRTEAATEKASDAIVKAFPGAPAPRVAPTSRVIRELGKLADSGKLPHVRNRFAMLSDGGHLSNYGKYAVNVTLCAMMYNEPPFAYSNKVPALSNDGKWYKVPDLGRVAFEIPAETADVIKHVVWDVLSTYPRAGINVGLVIADRSLPPAITKQPYRFALKALNAGGKVAWSLVKGSLPDGVKLAADGSVSGEPTVAGKFPITVQAVDGDKRFERSLTLVVSEDLPPVVADVDLPKIPLDRDFFQELKARGGVGHLAWSLVDGKLPHGVVITKPGILVGTPGEEGEFNFKVRVEDSHPAGPRSAEKALKWTIGPASPEALLVRKTAEPITIDGKLDESFWSPAEKVARKVQGSPTATATLSIVWTDKSSISKSGCLYVAVKVLDGPAGKTPKDAVEVFLDALHNREVIYNADDMHFIVGRDGKSRSLKGKPNWFLKTAAAEIEGGYVIEMAIPTNYWHGEGSWVDFGAKAVYGFDIAVDEGDKQLAQQVWRGTEKNADDTSGFGSIVLTAEPAGQKTSDAPAPKK